MAPRIAITTKIVNDPDYRIEVQGACSSYAESVIDAGGLPFFIPLSDPALSARYIEACDGVIFSGGEDVDPFLYGATPSPKLGEVSRRRDDFELSLFQACMKAGKPILGICRGLQLINVALGGTLIQDIPSELQTQIQHTDDEDRWLELVHSVEVKQYTLLSLVMKEGVHKVNSIHHQCIKDLGRGLRVSSVCRDDGVIEAIESDSKLPLVAVQWHPEVLWQDDKTSDARSASRGIFRWLIDEAVKTRA